LFYRFHINEDLFPRQKQFFVGILILFRRNRNLTRSVIVPRKYLLNFFYIIFLKCEKLVILLIYYVIIPKITPNVNYFVVVYFYLHFFKYRDNYSTLFFHSLRKCPNMNHFSIPWDTTNAFKQVSSGWYSGCNEDRNYPGCQELWLQS